MPGWTPAWDNLWPPSFQLISYNLHTSSLQSAIADVKHGAIGKTQKPSSVRYSHLGWYFVTPYGKRGRTGGQWASHICGKENMWINHASPTLGRRIWVKSLLTVANAEKQRKHKVQTHFLPSASRSVLLGFLLCVCAADERTGWHVSFRPAWPFGGIRRAFCQLQSQVTLLPVLLRQRVSASSWAHTNGLRHVALGQGCGEPPHGVWTTCRHRFPTLVPMSYP